MWQEEQRAYSKEATDNLAERTLLKNCCSPAVWRGTERQPGLSKLQVDGSSQLLVLHMQLLTQGGSGEDWGRGNRSRIGKSPLAYDRTLRQGWRP